MPLRHLVTISTRHLFITHVLLQKRVLSNFIKTMVLSLKNLPYFFQNSTSSTLQAVLAEVSMNINPCSLAKASPSSLFTSLRDSKSLQEINWKKIKKQKLQIKEDALKESHSILNCQFIHKEYRSYMTLSCIGLPISLVS